VLNEYDTDPRFVKAVCKLMGIPFQPDKTIKSPLRPDTTPSCCIHLSQDGVYKFHDFTDEGKYYAMCQVWGAFITKQEYPLPELRRTEFAVWQTRLLLHLGWIEPVPVGVNRAKCLVEEAPKAAKEVYDGFLELLQVQAQHYGELRPVPYTRCFCAKWTGLSEDAAKYGLLWLKDHGWLKRVGELKPKVGRVMGLFLPRGLYPDS
jgi:hypothetical protein